MLSNMYYYYHDQSSSLDKDQVMFGCRNGSTFTAIGDRRTEREEWEKNRVKEQEERNGGRCQRCKFKAVE